MVLAAERFRHATSESDLKRNAEPDPDPPDPPKQTVFGGWARMAVPVARGGLVITEVKKPNLGERIPAAVRAEITVDVAKFTGRVCARSPQH